MAKKKQEKKVVENVDIDALVDEGKDVDVVKVAEVIADNTEETDGVEVEDLIQEAKDTQSDEIIKTVMEDAVEDEDFEEVDEEIESEVNEDSDKSDEPYDDGEDIDDVIAECTGVEVPKKEKTKEPWYVARARRIGDYYNW